MFLGKKIQEELSKIVNENDSAGNGAQTEAKKSTEIQKHHSLLLKVLAFHFFGNSSIDVIPRQPYEKFMVA